MLAEASVVIVASGLQERREYPNLVRRIGAGSRICNRIPPFFHA